MRYAAFDSAGVWLFDFASDTDDVLDAFQEAIEEDESVFRVSAVMPEEEDECEENI